MRLAVIAVTGGLAITLIPPFLSERYVNDAFGGWREDVERAYDDLNRAASLNPLSDRPLLAEGAIAQSRGDTGRALQALNEAADLVPDEFATHYLLAEIHAIEGRSKLARRELEAARRLNPLSAEVDSLGDALEDPSKARRLQRERMRSFDEDEN